MVNLPEGGCGLKPNLTNPVAIAPGTDLITSWNR